MVWKIVSENRRRRDIHAGKLNLTTPPPAPEENRGRSKHEEAATGYKCRVCSVQCAHRSSWLARCVKFPQGSWLQSSVRAYPSPWHNSASNMQCERKKGKETKENNNALLTLHVDKCASTSRKFIEQKTKRGGGINRRSIGRIECFNSKRLRSIIQVHHARISSFYHM